MTQTVNERGHEDVVTIEGYGSFAPDAALTEAARMFRHMAIDCEQRYPMRAKKFEAMAKTIQKILKGDYD